MNPTRIKKIIFLKCVLLFSLLPLCLTAQWHVQSHFDETLRNEEDAVLIFNKIQDEEMAGVLLTETEDLSKKVKEAGLYCKIHLQIKNKKGIVVFQTPPEEVHLFPGDLFYPKEITFPGDLFDQLKPGSYRLNFKVVALDPDREGSPKNVGKNSLEIYIGPKQD